MTENTKIVFEGGFGEIVEKKSRFISGVYSVHSEEEALTIIETVKKKYWDARHNCYAFIIGNNREIQRYNDDGEPGGTAGKPMLDILLTEGLVNCLVVVTRYFGGTLLGTGGLVRAYQQSAKAGIENAKIAVRECGKQLILKTDYNGIGKIQYILGNIEQGAYLLESVYTDKVELKVLAKDGYIDSLTKKITEATNGKTAIEVGEATIFALVDGKPVIL